MINFLKKDIKIQDKYPTDIIKDNNVCVFFIPSKCYVNGGIMSIFSLCKYSREFCNDYNFVISTLPGKETYAKNNLFPNEENIYRWEQIFSNLSKDKNILFHIPENYLNKFIKELSCEEIDFLKECNIQVNILNQNIELMPDKSIIRKLFKITDNITQTTAHDKYSSQLICDKYGIPLHKFSVYLDISPYESFITEEKEKSIIFSPDENEYKLRIKNLIKEELPEYKILTPSNLPFGEYLKIVANASCVISFGEGFDGYFNISSRMGTIGFAVYNEEFFPSEKWKYLQNCYSSYDDMMKNLVNDIKEIEADRDKYKLIIDAHEKYRQELYGYEIFKKNIMSFYQKDYTYRPSRPLEKEDVISVIVTVYNHAQYIEQALDSIFSQKDIPQIEVLVGNDCSTDNTSEILERYAQKYPNMTVYNRAKNLGAQYNLKDLLSKSKGDYIAILEGDDYWCEGYLKTQYDTLLREEKAILSFTEFDIFQNGKMRHHSYGNLKPFMGPKYAIKYCRPGNFSCCMYRRKVVDCIPEKYYENKKNFCASFNFFALDNGFACFVKEPLMVYRMHNTSIWSSMSDEHQTLQAIDSLYRLSIDIPNKYDSAILFTINILTARFNENPGRYRERKLLKLTIPYAKKKRYKLILSKFRKM